MPLIRYPGSKSRLLSQVMEMMPHGVLSGALEYREPFFGAGAVGLHVMEKMESKDTQTVWINDADPDVVAMWSEVRHCPGRLKRRVLEYVPSTEGFYKFKEEYGSCIDRGERAFRKIVLHQTSFSGLGSMAGGPIGGRTQGSKYGVGCRWSKEKIASDIDKYHRLFAKFGKVMITCGDFAPLLDGDNVFVYCDPPYYEKGNDLYACGMDAESHARLAACVRETNAKWLVSYDNNSHVRELYDWATISTLKAKYTAATATTASRSHTTEVLVSPKLESHSSNGATIVAGETMTDLDEIIIDPEFRDLLASTDHDKERAQLKENIKVDGCRDPIVVWNTDDGDVLIDGHNRLGICKELDITCQVESLSFDSRADVLRWMFENQRGRRNMTSKQLSVLRGKLYNETKKTRGRPKKKQPKEPDDEKQLDQNDPITTADRVAEETGVSSATVKRDGKRAEMLDKIKVPEIVKGYKAGKFKISDKALAKLGKLSEKEQAGVLARVTAGKTEWNKYLDPKRGAAKKPSSSMTRRLTTCWERSCERSTKSMSRVVVSRFRMTASNALVACSIRGRTGKRREQDERLRRYMRR